MDNNEKLILAAEKLYKKYNSRYAGYLWYFYVNYLNNNIEEPIEYLGYDELKSLKLI